MFPGGLLKRGPKVSSDPQSWRRETSLLANVEDPRAVFGVKRTRRTRGAGRLCAPELRRRLPDLLGEVPAGRKHLESVTNFINTGQKSEEAIGRASAGSREGDSRVGRVGGVVRARLVGPELDPVRDRAWVPCSCLTVVHEISGRCMGCLTNRDSPTDSRPTDRRRPSSGPRRSYLPSFKLNGICIRILKSEQARCQEEDVRLSSSDERGVPFERVRTVQRPEVIVRLQRHVLNTSGRTRWARRWC